jgi:hypothetical protein
MSYRELRLGYFLGDFAHAGVNFWMTKQGWFWVQRGAAWYSDAPAPVHGPFRTVSLAAVHCERTLGLSLSGGADAMAAANRQRLRFVAGGGRPLSVF